MSRIRERQAPQRKGPEMADRKANAYFRFALALAGVLVVPAIQAEDGEKKPTHRSRTRERAFNGCQTSWPGLEKPEPSKNLVTERVQGP